MLNNEHHDRLIKDLDNICRVANIPKQMMHKSAGEFLSVEEMKWLVSFPVQQRENRGLVFTGKHTPSPDIKMMAMTAALLRNYVDSRLITVQALLDAHEHRSGELPDPTVLMIPNLFVKQGGKGLPSWKMQIVYDILLSRFAAGRLTVAYVENLGAMGAEYGSLFIQHLETNYLVSNG